MIKKLDRYIFGIFLLAALILYILTIRGNMGVPNEEDITINSISSGQAFETSQERSRYAIILSLYNYGTFNVDHFPQMGTPDVGFINGHYFSFFPPTVSIMAMPLYILGLRLGATQLLVFLVSTIFALATGILLFFYGKKLGLQKSTSAFIAFSFLFGTNAWGYSVTLYAHLVSAFVLLLGAYILQFMPKDKIIKGVAIWLLYALAIFIDFPNIFLFFPIALVYSLEAFEIAEKKDSWKVKLKFTQILTPIVFILCMLLYGYYNYTQFGSPTTLSNNLPRVRDLTKIETASPELGRGVVSALYTRRLLDGFIVFLVSTDRGVLVFSPIVLLSIFGIFYAFKKDMRELGLLVAIPLFCLTLYSMFSDPWGGWGYGSRYMIAAFPYLLLLMGIGLDGSKRKIVKTVYSLVFIYSVAVSLLAPLTTNVIPPSVEAQSLGLDANYSINWKMLLDNKLNSFFYNHILEGKIPAMTYYVAILLFTLCIGLLFMWFPKKLRK